MDNDTSDASEQLDDRRQITAPVNPKPSGSVDQLSDASADALARAKLLLEYLKVLAWPVFVVGLLAVYRPPIGRMSESLASKFETADSVKIGSLSLEVQQRARDLGSPELGREIGQLSFNAIEALVRTPRSGSMILLSTNDRSNPPEYGLPSDAELDGLRELEKKGLIGFEEPLDTFVRDLKAIGRSMAKDSRMRTEDRQSGQSHLNSWRPENAE